MKDLVRRGFRRIAGIETPTAVPSAEAVAELSRRLEAMDKGLQEMILATRAENDRGLTKVRAEIDALIELVDPPTAPQRPGIPTRSSNDS